MTRRFDAVVLDAGNTLVFVDPVRTAHIIHRHGGTGDAARFRAVEREARILLSRRVEDGLAGTEDHFWQVYFATLYRGMALPDEAWPAATAELTAVHARAHLWSHVDPGTEEALRRILEAGHRLAVVSNADGRVEGLLRDVGLARYFEFVLDSAVVGVSKPDPGIFRMALDRLGVEAARALYVGDLYPVDVLGARSAGMEAVLLDPFDALGHWTDVPRIPRLDRLPGFLESL